jgi:hypothetical protein
MNTQTHERKETMTSSGESISSESIANRQSPGVETGAQRSTDVDGEDGTDQATREDSSASVFEDIDSWVAEEQCDLPSDVVFEILKNQRRRLVLQYLRETEGPARLGTLAEHIAAFENGVAPTGLNAQQRKRVYIGLYQCHLPKMADAGVVEFDQDRGIVEMNDAGQSLISFLDADAESDRSPQPYFLVVAVGGLAFFLSRMVLPAWTADAVVVGLLAAVAVIALSRDSEA